MTNRKPFELVNATRLYSAIMVVCSVYFLSQTLPLTYFGGGYDYLCQGECTSSPTEPLNSGHGKSSALLLVASMTNLRKLVLLLGGLKAARDL